MTLFQWITEIGLSFILVVTLSFIFRLMRGMSFFSKNRAETEKYLIGLQDLASKLKAEITAFTLQSGEQTQKLDHCVAEAHVLEGDLLFLLERAEKTASGLEKQIKEARKVKNETAGFVEEIINQKPFFIEKTPAFVPNYIESVSSVPEPEKIAVSSERSALNNIGMTFADRQSPPGAEIKLPETVLAEEHPKESFPEFSPQAEKYKSRTEQILAALNAMK